MDGEDHNIIKKKKKKVRFEKIQDKASMLLLCNNNVAFLQYPSNTLTVLPTFIAKNWV